MYADTPIVPSEQLFQVAVMNRGKGRIAFIGEACLRISTSLILLVGGMGSRKESLIKR